MIIVVTGINSYGKSDNHISNLTDLYSKIKNKFSCDVLVMSKQILYTQVPIIKLEFSLKEYYNKRLESDISALPYIDFDSDKWIDPIFQRLSVDISLSESYGETIHLGLLQSNFVREKLQEYPVLKSVWLMLILVKNDLNNPYTGGIGLFSLFLMLHAAYFLESLNIFKSFYTESAHPARLLIWFLAYFSEYFDYKTLAIIHQNDFRPFIVPKLSWDVDFSKDLNVLYVCDPFNSK